MEITNILTVTLTLFAVIDILGSIPIIIALRDKLGHIESEKATIVSGALMIAFLFFGEGLLGLIGIDVSSFAIAGAIVILMLALELIMNREFIKEDKNQNTGSIVPIAFPLIAGAGTLTTLISLRAEYSIWEILIAVLINLVVVYVVLKTSGWFKKKLGRGGISILRRVFGVILLAIAIKLFKNNIGM